MRCPDCNRFVSFDAVDPELNVSLDGNGITGDVRVALACSECGQELKEYTFDVSIDVDAEHDCTADEPEDGQEEGEQYELVGETAEFLADTQTEYWDKKARKYRPIKNMRYAKTFYGASLDFSVKCVRCGEEFSVQDEVREAASAFDELV